MKTARDSPASLLRRGLCHIRGANDGQGHAYKSTRYAAAATHFSIAMNDSIELRHLRYFLAVAETENFTRAAERLKISQPSISKQITQLEQALRTPLFRRVGKRVFLTEAGQAFRKGAEVVLRKLEDACNSVGN